jgi:uncharacterized protein YjbI with pentapeptide repeats
VVATYGGDINFLASTSPELGEAVTRCLLGAFGCVLAGADLVNADLAGQVLGGDDLAGANLSGADVRATLLFFADMDRANLAGTDFSEPSWCS